MLVMPRSGTVKVVLQPVRGFSTRPVAAESAVAISVSVLDPLKFLPKETQNSLPNVDGSIS